MKILPVPFAILTYFGIWMPIEWTCKWKKTFYNLLSVFVLFIMVTFVKSELIEVVLYLFRNKGISETLYLLLTTSSACYKAVILLVRKKNVIALSDMLLNDRCISRDKEEKLIQARANKINRYVTGICVSIVYSDILTMIMAPLFQTSSKRKLSYKTWLPYSIENPRNYWLSYTHQVVGLLCCGSVSLATDNIVTGFMLQASTQFDILQHRFQILPSLVEKIRTRTTIQEASRLEKIMLARLLKHHNYIYHYAKNIMQTFRSIIFVQFCASAMVITFSVYQLSMTNPKKLDFITVLVYLIGMLTEFFMYCWFGNEVTLKSINFADNVYKSNWNILNLQSWKMILFLIKRSSMPIVFSCYNMVVLSLDLYVHILKLSYSTYNILRQSGVD